MQVFYNMLVLAVMNFIILRWLERRQVKNILFWNSWSSYNVTFNKSANENEERTDEDSLAEGGEEGRARERRRCKILKNSHEQN